MIFDLQKIKLAIAKNNFDVAQRVLMYEKIMMGLEDGVSIREVISDLHKRYVKRDKIFQHMTREWIASVDSGQNFSIAIKEWVPESELYMIAAGEEKNNLLESFGELIRTTRDQEELAKTVKKKIYPQVFVLAALVSVIYGFSKYLAPGFKEMTPEEEWPDMAVNYFAFSDWAIAYFPYIGAFMGVFGLLALVSFKLLRGPLREALDKYPPWSVYREIESAKLLVVLSGMLKSGIAINDSIEKLNKFSTPYMKGHLNKMRARLSTGMDEGTAMSTGLFPDDLADDVIDFSKRSGFSKGIMSLGRRMSKQTSEKIADGADKVGKYLNYAIYLYVAFTVIAVSEIVTAMINKSF